MARSQRTKESKKHPVKEGRKMSARGVVRNAAALGFHSVGDKLYALGVRIARYQKNSWRTVKKRAGAVGRILRGFVQTGWNGAVRIVKKGWTDLTMPVLVLGRAIKNYALLQKDLKGRSPEYRKVRTRFFFRSGWQRNRHVVGRMFSYAAPILASVTCLAVVVTVISLNYAIQVSYNGEIVGYIENESVYDSARKIIESRIISSADEPIWTNSTELGIAVVPYREMVSQDIMAESLLRASDSEIVDATGIYIGGKLYGAAEDGESLIEAVEALKEPYLLVAEELGDDTVVTFSREIEYVSGIFPAASIRTLGDLIREVTSQAPRNLYVTANIGDSVTDILRRNGLTLERLKELNPSVTDFTFSESGAELLIAQEEPLVRVKLVRVLSSVESIGYEVEVTYSEEHAAGTVLFLQNGEPGERTVTREREYDADGVLLTEIILSETVTKEPVTQKILVGTQGVALGGTGGGIYVWPTGGPWRVSRGWSPSTALVPHAGIDIAAAYGTPIYAGAAGTVITALYTDVGYGVYVVIDHGDGFSTLYGHCSALLVQQGDVVARGQMIGLMGSTGNSTGDHLHFEVRVNGERVPPEPYISYFPSA